MSVATTSHIHVDDTGRAWIDDTNVKVIEVVIDKLAHGSSPEEMHFQYPHLSLAQIYAASLTITTTRNSLTRKLRGNWPRLKRWPAKQPTRRHGSSCRHAGKAALSIEALHGCACPPPSHGRVADWRGVDVVTAQEDEAARLPDPELLDRATALDLRSVLSGCRSAARGGDSSEAKTALQRPDLRAPTLHDDWASASTTWSCWRR